MRTNFFYTKKYFRYVSSFLLIALLTSCFSIKNSSYYDSDGIYGDVEPRPSRRQNLTEYNSSSHTNYFDSFNDDSDTTSISLKSKNYDSSDTLYSNYPSWGSNPQDVSLNYFPTYGIHPYYYNSFYTYPFYGGHYYGYNYPFYYRYYHPYYNSRYYYNSGRRIGTNGLRSSMSYYRRSPVFRNNYQRNQNYLQGARNYNGTNYTPNRSYNNSDYYPRVYRNSGYTPSRSTNHSNYNYSRSSGSGSNFSSRSYGGGGRRGGR